MLRHLPERSGNTFPYGEKHFMSQHVTFISFSVISSCFLITKTLPAQDHPTHLNSTCVRFCAFISSYTIHHLSDSFQVWSQRILLENSVLGPEEMLSWQSACHRSVQTRIWICSTHIKTWERWHKAVILALGRQRLEDATGQLVLLNGELQVQL